MKRFLKRTYYKAIFLYYRIFQKNIIIDRGKRTIFRDVETLLDFLKDNSVQTIDDFYNLNVFEKGVIKILLNKRDKKYQMEVEFYIELELSNLYQLKNMIKMFEDEEDYEKCSIIRDKITKVERLEKLNKK